MKSDRLAMAAEHGSNWHYLGNECLLARGNANMFASLCAPYRFRRGIVIFEGNISKAPRASAVIGHECISNLAIHLEGTPKKLEIRQKQ